MKILQLPLFLTITMILSPTYGASFDCSKAATNTEKTICSNSKLGLLDEKLSKSYSEMRSKFSSEAKMEIKKDQIAWLKSLEKGCQNNKEYSDCLINQYSSRIEKFDKQSQSRYGMFIFSTTLTDFKRYDQIDSSDSFSQFLNSESKKLSENINTKDTDVWDDIIDDGSNIEIIQLGENLFVLKSYIHTFSGMHFNHSETYTYYRKSDRNKLVISDAIPIDKLDEFSKFINSEIRIDAEQEVLDCYKLVTPKAIRSKLSFDLSSIGFVNNKFSLSLDVGTWCSGPYGDANISIGKVAPYLTDFFKTELLHELPGEAKSTSLVSSDQASMDTLSNNPKVAKLLAKHGAQISALGFSNKMLKAMIYLQPDLINPPQQAFTFEAFLAMIYELPKVSKVSAIKYGKFEGILLKAPGVLSSGYLFLYDDGDLFPSHFVEGDMVTRLDKIQDKYAFSLSILQLAIAAAEQVK